MLDKIAVIFNEANELSSFEEGSVLLVFMKEGSVWTVVEEIPYTLDAGLSISDIRDFIRTLILRLGDCKIVVGQAFTGLPYNVFDRMGFEIFEADNVSETLFDEILSDVSASGHEKSALPCPVSPVPTETEGVFFLNLIELQDRRPEISSKKALQSFIENNQFYKLEVICSHIPPWFDTVLPQKKMVYSAEEYEKNRLKVSIMKKVCSC